MKSYFTIAFFLFLFTYSSYSKADKKTSLEIDPKVLETNFTLWWQYHCKNIIFSYDFSGLDEHGKRIDKSTFLQKLTSGEYIAIGKNQVNGHIYQLYKLHDYADKDIRNTVKRNSEEAYKFYKMEGTLFPKFIFNDLNGNKYSNESLKGKVVVLKLWFIKCASCVAEFPILNKTVEKYQDRKDVVFLSLALDKANDLRKFLEERPFRYKVIPEQGAFITNNLNMHSYPTHLIIDKEGIVRKVVHKAEEMNVALDNISGINK